MHFVYATGEPGQFDFHLAQTRAGVPSGARVFATCTGESLAEMLDEHTFHAMTDGEYYELQALIRKARKLEAERKRLRGSGVLDRVSSWLLGRQNAKTASHRAPDHLPLTQVVTLSPLSRIHMGDEESGALTTKLSNMRLMDERSEMIVQPQIRQ